MPEMILKFAIACVSFGALCALMPTSASAAERPRTISLSASGSVSARPDIAEISTGVTSDAKTAREALNANTKSMTDVIDALKGAGIDEKDIQTSNFSVSPLYRHFKDGRPAEITGYRVSNSVRIVVRDLKKLGGILDEVVTLGSNQINGISFSVSETAELLDKARVEAMEKAIKRAKLYTEASGTKLGRVLTINEQTYSQPPRPVYARAMRMEAAKAVPVEAGEQELQVRISVSWELE